MFAVPGLDARPLEKSRGVVAIKKGVAVIAAAQNEVKEADAFYLVVYNRSGQFISLDRSQIRLLDHNGKEYKPLSKSQKNFLLGARYTPRPPVGIKGDVFRYDRSMQDFGDISVSPLNPGEIFRKKIMPGSRSAFFVYFRKRSIASPVLTLIVPQIELGGTREKITFLFKFEVQRE
jgi:hypothetical protein